MAITNVSRLHQVLAVLPDVKNRAKAATEGVYHQFQRNVGPLSGLSRTYRPKDVEGDQLPPEQTLVQLRVPEMMLTIESAISDLLNLEFTAEEANTRAKGTVKIDDQVILEDVPVTYLIFVEKQLTDLSAIVKKIPTLDPAEVWHWDDNSLVYATDPTESTRTSKNIKVLTKAPATDKHPAQTETYYEDEVVGYWTKIQFSGALPGSIKVDIVRRIETLKQAVKAARAEGNGAAVQQERAIGKKVFDYILAPLDTIGRQ